MVAKYIQTLKLIALPFMFPAFVVSMFAFSHLVPAYAIPRYDFIFIACLVFLGYMVKNNYHTLRHLFLIGIAFYLGLLLEIYKTNTGVFTYHEFGYTKFFGVPLYAGLIYSSVASVVLTARQHLGFEILNWGNRYLTLGLGMAIYFSFFLPADFFYVQYILLALAGIAFYKTSIQVFFNTSAQRFSLLLLFAIGAAVAALGQGLIASVGSAANFIQHTNWQGDVLQKSISITLASVAFFIICVDGVLYNKSTPDNKI